MFCHKPMFELLQITNFSPSVPFHIRTWQIIRSFESWPLSWQIHLFNTNMSKVQPLETSSGALAGATTPCFTVRAGLPLQSLPCSKIYQDDSRCAMIIYIICIICISSSGFSPATFFFKWRLPSGRSCCPGSGEYFAPLMSMPRPSPCFAKMASNVVSQRPVSREELEPGQR